MRRDRSQKLVQLAAGERCWGDLGSGGAGGEGSSGCVSGVGRIWGFRPSPSWGTPTLSCSLGAEDQINALLGGNPVSCRKMAMAGHGVAAALIYILCTKPTLG